MTTHPLDDALTECKLDIPPSANTTELIAVVENAFFTIKYDDDDRWGNLAGLIEECGAWLMKLGVNDPGEAFRDEYDQAVLKHPGMTLDQDAPTDFQRACALIEEVREVARAPTYDEGDPDKLISEVTQVGALAAAWLAHVISKEADQ